MAFQTSVSITYKDLFDDYDEVKIEDLLQDIPSKNSIQIMGYFIAQLHTLERDPTIQIEFFKMWIGRFPSQVIDGVKKFINKIESNPTAEYNFLNNTSLLILTQNILINHNDKNELENLSDDQELNFFKAYLFCSQKWIDEQNQGFKKKDGKNETDLIKMLLPTQLPYQEIFETKDFRIQFIKAVYFFEFCENNNQFKEYLDIFLKEYKLKSWKEYLSHLLELYIRKFERLNTPSIFRFENESEDQEKRNFLENLVIQPEGYSPSKDFLNLRNKPVYKLNENDYVFLNLNFLVDKIYQGIQFEFARILVKNKAKYKDKIIKSPIDFIGIFGNEFSENGLFYSVMDYAFDKNNYKRLTGEQLKDFLKDGEPDYYIRDKGKIYVFEYKNVFLGAKTKHSYDYDEIKKEIFKKLVKNEKKSPKGVTQLVEVIEKIKKGDFNKFDDFNSENIVIYPIIVYVDFSFNLAGINYILNNELRKQVEEKKFKNLHKIKDLTMIDLDSFIKFQDLFRNKKLKINNCLNTYFEYKRDYRDATKRISTFNMFIHHKTDKMEYESPEMLMDKLKEVLELE
jgi:hypothetical protein